MEFDVVEIQILTILDAITFNYHAPMRTVAQEERKKSMPFILA
jgi:hypothetical protein